MAKEKGGGLGHTSSYQNINTLNLLTEENRSQAFKREMKNTRKIYTFSCLDLFLLPVTPPD